MNRETFLLSITTVVLIKKCIFYTRTIFEFEKGVFSEAKQYIVFVI